MHLIKTLAVCAAMAITPATTAFADATSQISSSALQRLASYRASAGLNPLQRNPRLDAAARAHAQWIARTGRYGHAGQGGSSHADRARAAGYCYRALAENIAWGIPSSDQVVEGWMRSPGHRRNIMMPQLREYGIAGANGYWVMVIGTSC